GVQLGRYGITYGAQMLTTTALFPVMGPAAFYVGPWVGCGMTQFMYTYLDYAKQEQWDLHPEIVRNNVIYWTKMCSPAGFAFTAIEAEKPSDKLFALSGALTYVPNPYINLAGQVGPSTPQIISNMYLFKNVGPLGIFGNFGFKP